MGAIIETTPATTPAPATPKSRRKLTPQREAFCRHIVRGYSAAEAYRRSYTIGDNTKPHTIHTEAYKLRENPDVAHRIAELTAQAAARAVVSRETMLAEMAINRSHAIDHGNISAANTASRDRARVAGLLSAETDPGSAADEAAEAVAGAISEVAATYFDLGRRVYFAMELGKRRANAPLPLPEPPAD